MVKFPNLAASSAASGFQYYKTKEFSFAVPGQFLPLFSGSISDYTSTHSEPKLRPIDSPSSIVITSALINVDADMTAGTYKMANGSIGGTVITGTSGGFPVFYQYGVSVSSDSDNVNISLNVSNPSAVNDVTPPTITVSGKLFFYLAPF